MASDTARAVPGPSDSGSPESHPDMTGPRPGEQTVLVLQGGGALGSYQAGAFEALAEAGYNPGWLSGISIGAVNAALIAGNPPEKRLDALRKFWETVSSGLIQQPILGGDAERRLLAQSAAFAGSLFGIPGFFRPRLPPPFAQWQGGSNTGALSYYDTAPLRQTLEELIDFDRLNGDGVRLSVGAVDIETGNFTYFDSHRTRIGPEHIMASGALPPGLPPVEIDGRHYWDGGIVSNTPLNYVLEYTGDRSDMCIFQVDLFSSRGPLPDTIFDVAQREKEIRYSSRTRLNTDQFRQTQTMRRAARRLIQKLPPELRDDPDAVSLEYWSCNAAITIAHLINRRRPFDTDAKDYEFSRLSMEERWVSGNTFGGVSGFSLLVTKSAPVVACCTPILAFLIEAESSLVPFFTMTPMSEEK